MQQELMKKTAVFSILFTLAAMGCMIYLSVNRVITISNVAQDSVERGAEERQPSETREQILTFVLGENDTSYLRIPLPKECKAENIVIENHYMDRELCVQIASGETDFYLENAISGNREKIRQGSYEECEDGIKLWFQLTGVFEYRTILEGSDLYISFLDPREVYDRIIVIDPSCGGANAGYVADGLSEKNITLQIARKLKEKLDKTDIKAYYTRMEDVNPSEEKRAGLANETRADMYIRIQLDADEDSGLYGTTTVYNESYFIPGFGSVELADILEREVVTSIKGKALGLEEADGNDYTLRNITVPAAGIKAGYLTNKQEAILLGREEYQDKIADGIYNAVMGAYKDYFR